MPGKVKVKIISGRNLPVMDRSSDTTDAYVEIKLGSTTYKTDVCRKSLHPHWNTEWYRFEVDDSELQDEPLQIRLMDHDTYSANDAIGKVYLNLNPLLLPAAGNLHRWTGDSRSRDTVSSNTTMMSGWLPVYDTMHGIRGEVDVSVKVEHFSDFNKFRQSSCGIQFFYSPAVPHGFYAHTVQGFVEELIVNDDPEYQWIDKIRTPRASNEARQTLFCKLAGELQRKIGVKALDLGGNAVIGYRQAFDLEGESGIVARGIGTAVTLVKATTAHGGATGIPGENLNGEERVLSYMRFLGSTKGFFLHNHINGNNNNNRGSGVFSGVPPFPFTPSATAPPLSQHSPIVPYKHTHAHSHHHHHKTNTKPHITRHLSDKDMHTVKPIPDDSLHHSHSLQTLLKQEDMRGRPSTSAYRISNRFWKFKTAKLSKRITHLKAKLSDTGPLTDSASTYRRTSSDSSGMAAILVRSVIHAANSLDCIVEAPTPSSSPALVVVASTSASPPPSPQLPPRDVSGSYLSLPSTSMGSCSSKTSESSDDDDDDDDDDEDDDDDDDESKAGSMEDIGEVVKRARKLSIMEGEGMPLVNVEERKVRNENTKNLFYLELEQDVVDDVDNSDTVSEPVNFSPGKPVMEFHLELDSSDAEEEPAVPRRTVLGVPFTNIFNLQDTNTLPVSKNQYYRRSISHNIDKYPLDDVLFKKKHHGSHDTVLGVPFTNIFQTNSIVTPPANGHDSAILHIEREIEVSESMPFTDKRINKSATFMCLKDLAQQTTESPKAHHKSHDTLQTIPFGSIFQSREHVTIQFPKTIEEGATLNFTCDRTVTRDKLVKSSTSTSLSEYFTSQKQARRAWNKSLDIVFDEPSDAIMFHETIVTETNTPIDETPSSPTKPKRITKLVDFAKKTKENVVKKLKRGGSTIRDKHGLLNTALGNVLMESVNEMLVSSSHEAPVVVESPDDSKYVTTPTAATKKEQPPKQSKLQQVRAFFRRKSSVKDEVKSGGLLQCALDNVLMGTCNEMLATSQPTKQPTNPFVFPKSQTTALQIDEAKTQCALDNVLIQTCNEMLATSQPTKPVLLPQSKPTPSPLAIDFTNPTNAEPSTAPDTTRSELVENNATSNNAGMVPTTIANTFARARLTTAPAVARSLPPPAVTMAPAASPPPTPPPAQLTPPIAVSLPQPITAGRAASPLYHQAGHQRAESVGGKQQQQPLGGAMLPPHSPAKLNSITCIHRRSSDSDLSVTSKGNSLTGSDRSGGYSSGHYMRANNALIRSTVPQENFDILEYPFLTMSQYPSGFISFLGGAVNARSVKLLERITNIEEPESRDIWWSEIRMEIRSHARALNCNAVLGYKETTSICDEVCVLSASGTAAVIGYQYTGIDLTNASESNYPSIPPRLDAVIPDNMTSSLDRNDFEKERSKFGEFASPNITHIKATLDSPDRDLPPITALPTSSLACSICHLPYKAKVAQLRNTTSKCSVCRGRKVPDVLIATIEVPEGVPTLGRGCFLQSYVCRPLKDLKGESNAKEISDGLPFLEYELHRLLLNKLKVKGMNAIFGLNVRITIGERMLIGIATGTAIFLTPLPVPPIPKLRSTDEDKLAKLQKKLHETVKKNREIYQLINDLDTNRILSDDDSEDDRPSMELNIGNKDCCVLEVDDPEDVTELNLLMEPRPPDGFHVVSTECVPGLDDLEIVKNLQMFTQLWRSRIQPPYNFDQHFHRLLQTVYFKLRRMVPCALCHLQFRVESPEPEEIQLCVLGMALGLGDPSKTSIQKRKNLHLKRNDDDLIFNIEDDLIPENSVPVNTNLLHTQTSKSRQKSPVRNRYNTKQQHLPYKERHGVDITPLSYVPGGKIEKYLGNLNFFFIRETNSIREEGGLSGFMHSFVTEVLAIVRSHVTALGGNAMVAYYLTECILNHNLHKNQGQCLINVGGDVVFVSYYADDH